MEGEVYILFRFISFLFLFTSTLVSPTGNGLNRWLTHPFFFSGVLGIPAFLGLDATLGPVYMEVRDPW